MAQSYRSGLVLFAAFFAAVFALKASTLWQPPVWDTAMGLFPAAITLAENGFDGLDLLGQPGFLEGGPRLHPFSIVTWITALILALLGDSAALPTLHVLHFAATAFTLLGLFRLAAPRLGEGLALGLVAVTLVFPLFSTQAGYLYFEMPLALCTVWAVHAAVRRAWGRALAWSALACFVKEAGVIVPVALGCAAALERESLRRVAAFAVAPALLMTLHLVFELQGEGPVARSYLVQIRDTFEKLTLLPDLAGLLVLFAASAVLVPFRIPLLVVGAFAGFYALIPLTGADVYVLPRYYVQIVPLVLLGAVELARHRLGRRGAAVALALLGAFFVLNRSGAFYPPIPGNEFSLAERSGEYRDLLAVQRRLVEAGARVPSGTPVLYGLPEHYLFRYPRLGYVERPPSDGRCVWLERSRPPPEHFVALYNFVGYGGPRLQSLVRQARRDPARRVDTTVFEQGRYRTALFRVGPAGARDVAPVQGVD